MENKETQQTVPASRPEPASGIVDTANVQVNAHLLIKDRDTQQILVNQRG